MEDCNTLSTISPWVTWFLVVIGWWWVSKSHAKRETRKEMRALLDDIVKQVYEIEDSAHRYFMVRPDDIDARRLSFQIKRELKRMAARINQLYATLKGDSDDQIVKFRQAITLHDFDDPNRRAYLESDVRIEEISVASLNLVTNLEKSYRQIYCRAILSAIP